MYSQNNSLCHPPDFLLILLAAVVLWEVNSTSGDDCDVTDSDGNLAIKVMPDDVRFPATSANEFSNVLPAGGCLPIISAIDECLIDVCDFGECLVDVSAVSECLFDVSAGGECLIGLYNV